MHAHAQLSSNLLKLVILRYFCILQMVYLELLCMTKKSNVQDSWRQQVTGGKLREIQEEAKSFAIGNKALAALFVHTPAGELQRQIRSWLAENFEFLSVTGDDSSGGATGQLELLSTAIMDGWMAGLGAALPLSTDALGQLLFEYAKRVYTSQLQHLKVCLGLRWDLFWDSTSGNVNSLGGDICTCSYWQWLDIKSFMHLSASSLVCIFFSPPPFFPSSSFPDESGI
jgi:hypothetical protein